MLSAKGNTHASARPGFVKHQQLQVRNMVQFQGVQYSSKFNPRDLSSGANVNFSRLRAGVSSIMIWLAESHVHNVT